MNSEGRSNHSLSPKLRACVASVIGVALVLCAALRVEPAGSKTTTQSTTTRLATPASVQDSLQSPAPPQATFLRRLVSANAPTLTPAAPEDPEREDLEGRDEWFYFQRTYPSSSLPRDARRAAWNARKRFEIDSVGPAASDTGKRSDRRRLCRRTLVTGA